MIVPKELFYLRGEYFYESLEISRHVTAHSLWNDCHVSLVAKNEQKISNNNSNLVRFK